jgi:ATP-dependent RNA helicase DBP3
MADGSLVKKRKLEAPAEGAIEKKSKRSKEERREAKRLKKAQAEGSSDLYAIINGTHEESKIKAVQFAARKHEKAKANADHVNGAGSLNGNGTHENLDEPEETLKEDEEEGAKSQGTNGTCTGELDAMGKDAVKLARKMKKAKAKAARANASESLNGNATHEKIDLAEVREDGYEEKPAKPQGEAHISKTARKAEKARLKEVRKAGLLQATNGSTEKLTKSKKLKNDPTNARSSDYTSPVNGSQSTDASSGYEEHPSLSLLPQYEIDAFLSKNFITIIDPTSVKPLRPIMTFSQLPRSDIENPSLFEKFQNPTPIQSASWPFLLSGRDVIGVAETGSGKTLAFGLPCIRHIASLPLPTKKGSAPRAVMVSPTRELAVQIHDQITQLATPAGLKTVCVYGGVPKDAQRQALKTAHIVVATPGRLNDLINEGAADLSNVRYVVLDEADRMLDKGFEEEIRKIVSSTAQSPSSESSSKIRQTLMFTATWPQSIRELAATFMRSPVKIAIGDNPTGELRANTSITQRVEVVSPYDKEIRLVQLLKQNSPPSEHTRILVFCLYKKEASRIEGMLRSKGFKVAGIHGDMTQEKRSASLEAFKRDKGCPILVATDVAARGLDIPAVKCVINVTFPLTVEDYVHRIGRYVAPFPLFIHFNPL